MEELCVKETDTEFVTRIEDFIKYEDVKNITVEEFFNKSEFSASIFRNKYMIEGDETVAGVFWRVTCYIASAEEKEEDRNYWSRRWFHELWTGQWMAAGSILQGAANPNKISLANCTTLRFGRYSEKGDTLKDIHETAYAVSKTAAYRQGLGVLFEQRPKGMAVNNSSKESQGVTHWMKYINEIGHYIGQKGRIPAMLLAIKDNHPDLLDFITIKSDQKTIDNANISVQWSDDFMRTLEQDGDWTMRYETEKGDVFGKIVKASEIFDAFVANNWSFAEPGAQFVDTAKRYSNSDYLGSEEFKVVGTNAPVTGDTLVPTKEGIFPIRDLYAQGEAEVIFNDIVNSKNLDVTWNNEFLDNRSQIRFENATFKRYPNQKVYQLKMNNGAIIKCNYEHRWFTQDGMKKTENLITGDKIFYSDRGLVELLDNVEDEKSLLDGSLCGWFTGDGFWVKPNKNLPRGKIGILWREDETIARDLFFDKYKYETGKTLRYIRNRGNELFETSTGNKYLLEFFWNKGYVNTKYHIPQDCYLDQNFCKGFLRGLFDADGSVDTSGRSGGIILTSSNKYLINEVQKLLLMWFGIRSTITYEDNSDKGFIYKTKDGIKKSKANGRYDLRICGHNNYVLFENNINFLHKRKQDRLKTLVERVTRFYKNKNYLLVDEVIETNNIETMYCAVVSNTQSFILNGLVSSNCSEQYLESSGWDVSAGLCVLSSFNMGSLPGDIIRAKKILRENIGPSMARFLDNVVEMELRDERYAIPGQKYSLEQLRRIGAGPTNLDGWMIQNDIGYDTEKGHDVIFEMLDSFNLGLYEESIKLGFEKGNFEAFEKESFIQSPFIKQMMERHNLDFHTMRNVCCSSIAPTGSLSMLFREPVISYGIEPIIGLYWWKRNRTSGKYVWHFCVPGFVRDILLKNGVDISEYGMEKDEMRDDSGELGIKISKVIEEHLPKTKFKPAHEIDPMRKIKLMASLTKHCIDSSISVTYNLPEDVSHETIKNIYLEGWRQGVKSISIYRDKSRKGIVEFVPPLEAEKRFSDEEDEYRYVEDIVTNNAPKRPERLPAEVHHVRVHGEDWMAFVGIFNEKPFEVFAGKSEDINLSRKTIIGSIEKTSRGYYFYPENSEDKISITRNFMEDSQSALTRQISLNLRHGTPLPFIMDQLDKSKGLVSDFSKVIGRVLKKYVKYEDVNGMLKCPGCNKKGTLQSVEGCFVCNDCGYGKC